MKAAVMFGLGLVALMAMLVLTFMLTGGYAR